MSMSRQQWQLVAALGLWSEPQRVAVPSPSRVAAELDPAFAVPDSVRALLTVVTALVVGPDQSLYLADPQVAAILHLDSSGAFRQAIGRRGEGPGEFQTVIKLGLYRDSLWAMDPALGRLTLMPLRGPGVTTVPFGGFAPVLMASARPQTRRGMPAAVLPDGSLLVQENTRNPASPVGDYSHAFLLRTGRSMEVLDTLARLPMGHSTMQFVFRDGALSHNQPFGDDPLYATSTDGSLLVTVTRVAPRRRSGAFTVTVWQGGKQRLFSREIGYAARRLPRSAVDSAVDMYTNIQRRLGPRTPVTADSIRRHLFRPAYFPPVEEVKIARDGAVWLKVRLEESPEGVGDWLVLSRRGFEQARVTLPASFRLLEADRRIIWGVEGDLLDVPWVVRYRIPDGGA